MSRTKRDSYLILSNRYIIYNKRKVLGYTQQDMMNFLGLKHCCVYQRYERGYVIPKEYMRYEICRILYLNINEVWVKK